MDSGNQISNNNHVTNQNAVDDHNYSKMSTNIITNNLINQDHVHDQNDNVSEWQTVTSPHKRGSNSNSNQNSKKSRQSRLDFTLKTNNSFDPLDESDVMDDETTQTSPTRDPKPPPIFVPDVVNVKNMITTVESVILNSDYTYKCINQNKIKLNPVTIDAYRKLVNKFTELKINFHTYQLKQDKAYRVVLKHMHFSTATVDIKNSIEEHGFKVRNVTNAKQYKTKTPLSMFFVDLEPNPNNKDIFDLQFLLNAKVSFEPPYKRNDIVQCKNCQNYGHTKSYCWHQPRCVKCGQKHDTRSCTKLNTEPPTCALCKGNHPANYKGCNVYRDLKNKTFPPLRPKDMQKTPTGQNDKKCDKELPKSTEQSRIASPHISYAQVASARNTPTTSSEDSNQNNVNLTLQSFFDRFEKLMLQQAQQIGTLLNLLTTVVAKLK